MTTPYHPIVGDPSDVDFPGTASLFSPTIGTYRKGDGTYGVGELGVTSKVVDDVDLSSALNALYYNDEARWPEEGGSNVPLKTWLVDCPDANLVANYLGQNKGWLDGTPPALTSSSWYSTASDDASGTVPYVNPAASGNPDAIAALNYLLDH